MTNNILTGDVFIPIVFFLIFVALIIKPNIFNQLCSFSMWFYDRLGWGKFYEAIGIDLKDKKKYQVRPVLIRLLFSLLLAVFVWAMWSTLSKK